MRVAKDNFTRQADLLAEAGVDFFMLEMMYDIDYTQIVLDAATQTGLPVWLGYSTERDDGTVWLFGKQVSFADALQALDTDSTELISIMHSLTEDIAPSLAVLKEHWSGLTGVYAHSGEFVMPNWQFVDMISAEAYAVEAERWVEQGVQLVGGCCGIGVEHIRVLAERLQPRRG